MILRRVAYGLTSFVLSIASLFVLVSPVVHAAAITWDGGGADNKFSTAANWVGDVVPANGDSIVIDLASGISDGDQLDNDIVGLQLSGITVTGAGLDFQGPDITGNAIELQGTIDLGYSGAYFGLDLPITLSGDVVFYGGSNVYLSSAATIDLAGHNLAVTNYSAYFGGVISGSGTLDLAPGMSVSLEAANTMSADITLNGGVLSAASSAALGSGTITITGNDSELYLCGFNGGTVNNNFVLNGSDAGAINARKSCNGGAQPTASDPVASATLNGTITLQKNTKLATQGTLTISGPLQGSFTIGLADGQLGSLVINSSDNQSSTPNGTIQSSVKVTEISDKSSTTDLSALLNEVLVIKDTGERGVITVGGGTLKGTGTVAGINMNSGKVAPGMSPGILNSGNTTFTGGTFEVELGGTTAGNGDGFYDQLNVTGTVDLGGATTLSVSHWNNFRPSVNNTFTIINNDGADVVSGTFQGLAEGSTVTVDGIVYSISYVGGDGNDVVLTATTVPLQTSATAPNTGAARYTVNTVVSLAVTMVIVAMLGALAYRQYRVQK